MFNDPAMHSVIPPSPTQQRYPIPSSSSPFCHSRYDSQAQLRVHSLVNFYVYKRLGLRNWRIIRHVRKGD